MDEAKRLLLVRSSAKVASRVLADLWPDGPDGAVRGTVDAWFFEVEAERDGVRVRRTGDLRREGVVWDVLDLGSKLPGPLPAGARQVSPGVVSVEVQRSWVQRVLRPLRRSESELEALCRRLNAVDLWVLGDVESACRVCGYDDGDERFIGGVPQYVICRCCDTESGVDDVSAQQVARGRREWIERGRAWRHPEDRPAGWDPDLAIAALPSTWRDL
ncbi:hypothetical protein [Blastococcus sp. CT_GayMR16]|uniref:hypothetical protein n=1 Tax=Blastococcus sp. CT_GayMR16 TaxID=2559607 RepID=UPI0010738D19|nr:hypothetical protein [Blastococcus sp. CT_GayMR16]TFV87181.1 hypothetical protein E4P38_14620 [Blastococcus sp. CT_GayMR16]